MTPCAELTNMTSLNAFPFSAVKKSGLALALSVAAFCAQAADVTVAYQTSAEPAKVAQAENTFAKESGAQVDWRKFDSGSSVLRALASGDVQIGNIGSSPLAVAASQKLPIEVFLLASELGSSEALVVKKSINDPKDLIGKPQHSDQNSQDHQQPQPQRPSTGAGHRAQPRPNRSSIPQVRPGRDPTARTAASTPGM